MRCFFLMFFLAANLMLMPKSAVFAKGDTVTGPLTGKVIEVIDGDTITVRVHVWIGQNIDTHVRIDGIDAPELRGKCDVERARAVAARIELQDLLRDQDILLSNIQYEKYAGRVLAQVSTVSGESVSEHMIEKGFARPYGGERRAGWCA